MAKVKKEFILKAVLLAASVPFLLNFIAYSSGLSETHNLKAPFLENNREYINKLLTKNKEVIENERNQSISDIVSKMYRLYTVFKETLTPLLQDQDISINRIRELLKPKEGEIYTIVSEIKKIKMKFALLDSREDRGLKEYLLFSENDSPDSSLCFIINGCLKFALQDLGIPCLEQPIVSREEKPHTMHVYIKVIGGSAGFIAMDGASGQFFPEHSRHIVVESAERYNQKIKKAIYKWASLQAGEKLRIKQERYRDTFIQFRLGEVLKILQAAELVS